MGDATAAERTSRSVWLRPAESELLAKLQRRVASALRLPVATIETSEDLQVNLQMVQMVHLQIIIKII